MMKEPGPRDRVISCFDLAARGRPIVCEEILVCTSCGTAPGESTFRVFANGHRSRRCRACHARLRRESRSGAVRRTPTPAIVGGVRCCKSCGENKPVDDRHFHKNSGAACGFETVCKACRTRDVREWKERNRDRIAWQRRANYSPERTKALAEARAPLSTSAARLATGAKSRARRRGVDVAPELTTRLYFEAWLARQPTCECCGVTFALGRKNGRFTFASPSLDRFNIAGGYTLDNVALICWRCNNIKRDYAAADLSNVAAWMTRREMLVQAGRR